MTIYNQRIQIFDLNGEFLQKIGKPGDRNGEFRLIDDIEVYNGKIYASDVKRKNIQEFDLSGNFIKTLDTYVKTIDEDTKIILTNDNDYLKLFKTK